MSRSSAALLVVLSLLLVPIFPAWGEPTRYEIIAGAPNEVRFHSKATIESFDGTTDRVSGWVRVDPDDLSAGAQWRVEVDMASLDTGIGLRNRHMRENHLHTDEFPSAVFEGTHDGTAWPASVPAGAHSTLPLRGEFTLHGITRERDVEAKLQRQDDGTLVVEVDLRVALSDHDIPRPKFLMMKLAEEQEVHLRITAKPETTEATP